MALKQPKDLSLKNYLRLKLNPQAADETRFNLNIAGLIITRNNEEVKKLLKYYIPNLDEYIDDTDDEYLNELRQVVEAKLTSMVLSLPAQRANAVAKILEQKFTSGSDKPSDIKIEIV